MGRGRRRTDARDATRLGVRQCNHYRYGYVGGSTRISRVFYPESFGRVIWLRRVPATEAPARYIQG